MSSLSNTGMVRGWLGYLQKADVAQKLVGTNSDIQLMDEIKDWKLCHQNDSCGFICSLLGAPGVDFAIEYPTVLEGHHFEGKLTEPFEKLFNDYRGIVGDSQHFYVQAATSRGVYSTDYLSVSFDLPKFKRLQVLRLALAWMELPELQQKLWELITLAQPLIPLKVGGRHSKKAHFKITFGTSKNGVDKDNRYFSYADFLQEMSARGYFKDTELLKLLRKDLEELSRFSFADAYLEMEVLPDGSIGPTVDIKLQCRITGLEQQSVLLKSSAYEELVQLMKSWFVVDERIDALDNCIFYSKLPEESALGHPEKLISTLDHFKLCYQEGKRKAARVYLKAHRV